MCYIRAFDGYFNSFPQKFRSKHFLSTPQAHTFLTLILWHFFAQLTILVYAQFSQLFLSFSFLLFSAYKIHTKYLLLANRFPSRSQSTL